tara:strand:- start:13749 stop:14048 length:300 start_codon:yes stop_codon:yes gene_type:complete
MNRWKNYRLNVGPIEVGMLISIVFQAEGPLPGIVSITPGCSCSSAKYNKDTMELTVKYRAESIPKHLRHQGWYLAGKKVTVLYTDKTTDVLSFIAKVTN